MKKKLFTLSLVAALPIVLTGCGNKTDDANKVALIVSAAGANDNGYNQSAIAGLNRAKGDFDITTQVVTSAANVPESLETLASEGYKLIFSLEYDFDALITNDGSGKSIAEKYPDTTFVVFNAFANTNEQGTKIHNNVIEVLFNIGESSFLAGALSVLVNEQHDVLFTDSAYHFTPTDQYRGLGFVGGTQSDGITVFGYGYLQGANYIAEQKEVTYNVYETYAAGFGASQDNYNTIDSYYKAGVNVVFAAAGGVSTNMKNAAKNNGKLSIDVDANQDESVPGHVLTSVLKNTEVAVYDIVDQYVKETLEAGADMYYDLKSGATGITNLSTIERYIAKTTEAQAAWTSIKETLADVEAKIGDGTIDVIDAQSGEQLDYTTLKNIVKVN